MFQHILTRHHTFQIFSSIISYVHPQM